MESAAAASSSSNDCTNEASGYKYVSRVHEGHGEAIYAVAFFPFGSKTAAPDSSNIFATVGSNLATVYKAMPDGTLKCIQSYKDEAWDEKYYTLCWSVDKERHTPLLVVAGDLGVIKVIDCHNQSLRKSVPAHGHQINHLRTHPHDSNIVISSSEDQSVRIFNIHTGMCLAILGGHNGHRAAVLCADIHLDGKLIATCGMDHAIKIWKIDKLPELIEESYGVPSEHENTKPRIDKTKTVDLDQPMTAEEIKEDPILNSNEAEIGHPTNKLRKHHTRMEQFPIYSRQKIHPDYVDHIQWCGDLLFSKSCEPVIKIWKPPIEDPVCAPASFGALKYERSELFFLRFDFDRRHRLVAVGNTIGQLYVWDLDKYFSSPDSVKRYKPLKLELPKYKSTIRSVCFNNNSNTILVVTDNGMVFRFEKRNKKSKK